MGVRADWHSGIHRRGVGAHHAAAGVESFLGHEASLRHFIAPCENVHAARALQAIHAHPDVKITSARSAGEMTLIAVVEKVRAAAGLGPPQGRDGRQHLGAESVAR